MGSKEVLYAAEVASKALSNNEYLVTEFRYAIQVLIDHAVDTVNLPKPVEYDEIIRDVPRLFSVPVGTILKCLSAPVTAERLADGWKTTNNVVGDKALGIIEVNIAHGWRVAYLPPKED